MRLYYVPDGRDKKVKETLYHRVFDDDSKSIYLKITKNIMREKGKLYWVNKAMCESEKKIEKGTHYKK